MEGVAVGFHMVGVGSDASLIPKRMGLKVFRKLIPYMVKGWRNLALTITCTIATAQLSVAIPIITRDLVDKAIIGGRYDLLTQLSLSIILVAAVISILMFIERYVNAYFAQKVILELRKDAFNALQKQSFAFFDRVPTGQLISRIVSDTDVLSSFLTWPLAIIMNVVILTASAFTAMALMSLELTLLSFTIIPLIFLLFWRYSMLISPIYLAIRRQHGALSSLVNNNLTGIRTVKALAVEDGERRKFSRENDRYLELTLKAARIDSLYNPLSSFIVGVGATLILLYGGSAIINGRLTIGQFVAFNSFLAMLTLPMRFVGMFIISFQRAMTAVYRVFEVIEAVPDVKEKPNAIELPPLKGCVKFKDVSFSYGDDKQVLKEVNLEVKPGERIVILGPTGSGKSTLIRLIPRFYDVSRGQILIDGYDVRDVKLKSLRTQLAIVSQEPFLFAGTVKDNIAFGRPDAALKEVFSAAKAARIHEFIESLPEGYNSIIGERGVTLSGGQKQRIAIARAILMNPRVLILDDPTSNLDAETERELLRDLRWLMEGRTTFIVTQRFSLVKEADRIIVIEQGRVVEDGAHEELMAKQGQYHKIYKTLYEAQEKPLSSLTVKDGGAEAKNP